VHGVPREDQYLRNKLAIIHIRDGLLGWVMCIDNLFSFIILYVGVNMYMLIVQPVFFF